MLFPPRRQVLRLGVGLAMAALVAGCSSTGSSSSAANQVSAKGTTLVIYLSGAPDPNSLQQQVLEAEQLACHQLSGNISGTSLSVKCDTIVKGELSSHARTAIQDESSIAYIGEIEPGDSEQSVGITNALDLPQVSPTDTAPIPDGDYEELSTYGRTFARIAPTSAQEAQAVLAEMKKLGVKNLYVTGDSSDYGRALQAAVRSEASADGITVNNSETAVNAIFYGGNSAGAAERYAAGASSTAQSTKLFLPSALAGLNFSSGDWSRFSAVYVSQPGPAGAADKSFASQFSSAYGSAPSPQAAYGYAAVQAVIHALDAAGKSATNRSTVRADLHKLSNLSTVVGPLSISADGNSSLGASAFVFSRLHAGRLVLLSSRGT